MNYRTETSPTKGEAPKEPILLGIEEKIAEVKAIEAQLEKPVEEDTVEEVLDAPEPVPESEPIPLIPEMKNQSNGNFNLLY